MCSEGYGPHISFVLLLLLGYRTYVALTYIGFNIVGFVVNLWVLYVVAPLLFAPAVKKKFSKLYLQKMRHFARHAVGK
ncbi:hypothetical protein NECAME_13019 [Necator americanus]|uniref:Uncharacterized protein n=1 Tax=Necator americanus TaxID=51031 RepID=W2SXZ9_NECAM|nr:hypothetical protein NECAME_13019 [Necator americanus]ETN74408.1 hypothetical protein NECAME_13019 [Necator americanus]